MALIVNLPRRVYQDEIFEAEFDLRGRAALFVATINPDQFGPNSSIAYHVDALVGGVWRTVVGPDTITGGSLEPISIEWGPPADFPATRGRVHAEVTGRVRSPLTVDFREF
jgi:hypothetical protein